MARTRLCFALWLPHEVHRPEAVFWVECETTHLDADAAFARHRCLGDAAAAFARVVARRRAPRTGGIVANEAKNPFGSFLDAAKFRRSGLEAAQAAADSLAPIPTVHLFARTGGSADRAAEDRGAERRERQDALFEKPSSPPAAPPPKNPLEKFVQAFTPVEVDRDGNVVVPPPPPPDDRDVGEKLFGLFFGEQTRAVAGIARRRAHRIPTRRRRPSSPTRSRATTPRWR